MSANFWLLVIFAFFFGVLIGWLLQRRTAGPSSSAAPGAAPPPTLGLVEAELKSAKLLLQANDADAATADERLAGLDETIKRVNKRLVLIIKAVKSAKFSD